MSNNITSNLWFCLQLLEKLLPPRLKAEVPIGEHVEEVNLTDYESVRSGGGGARAAYDEDDSDDEGGAGGGQRVQCAHQ